MRAMKTVCASTVLGVSALVGAISMESRPAVAMNMQPMLQAGPTNGPTRYWDYGQPVTLLLPQNVAFAILGYSCGGIKEQSYVTGFDPNSGYPLGDVYLSTTCSAGGKGGNTTTHTAWAAVTWDFAGNVISATTTSSPSVNPTFTAHDSFGDFINNAGGAAYLRVPYPGAPKGVTAVQSGDHFQISWTPTKVNPDAVASTTLTATPVNSSASVLTTSVTGSASTGMIDSLQPQTTYLITVVNTTVSGSGPTSNPLAVTTTPPTQPPGAPTGVTASWTNQNPTGSTDTFIVSWHAADPGDSPIDEYLIRVTNGDNNTSYTQLVSGTTLSASFTEDWNPDWFVTVQAHNAFSWGPNSNVFVLGGL